MPPYIFCFYNGRLFSHTIAMLINKHIAAVISINSIDSSMSNIAMHPRMLTTVITTNSIRPSIKLPIEIKTSFISITPVMMYFYRSFFYLYLY